MIHWLFRQKDCSSIRDARALDRRLSQRMAYSKLNYYGIAKIETIHTPDGVMYHLTLTTDIALEIDVIAEYVVKEYMFVNILMADRPFYWWRDRCWSLAANEHLVQMSMSDMTSGLYPLWGRGGKTIGYEDKRVVIYSIIP